jgi:hypothetical protein
MNDWFQRLQMDPGQRTFGQEASGLTFEEWTERRADFCRAMELYLEGRWKKPPAEKAH